jgi:hypothetical protein
MEVLERFCPSVANAYSTPAVVWIRRIAWVKTPLLNAKPYIVFGSSGHPVLLGDIMKFVMITSAAFYRTCLQCGSYYGFLIAAIAFTNEPCRIVLSAIKTNYGKSSEFLTSQILEIMRSLHIWNYNTVGL